MQFGACTGKSFIFRENVRISPKRDGISSTLGKTDSPGKRLRPSVAKPYKCDQCGEEFVRQVLIPHLNLSHMNTPHNMFLVDYLTQINYCPKLQDSLRSHHRHHQEMENQMEQTLTNTALAVLQLQHPVVADSVTGVVGFTLLQNKWIIEFVVRYKNV